MGKDKINRNLKYLFMFDFVLDIKIKNYKNLKVNRYIICNNLYNWEVLYINGSNGKR